MSPEPSQEPIEQNLKVPNLSENLQTEDESDTDDDVGSAAPGYLPLSQFPNDNEFILSDDDEDDDQDDFNQMGESDWTPRVSDPVDEEPNQTPSYSSETIQVWSSSEYNSSAINLDAEKINQVKSMMENFTLPAKSIPQWANTVSEDQWKDQLINRIKQIQKRET